MNVPFFDYPRLFLDNKSEYMTIIETVLSKGAYILQEELETFEENFAKFMNVPYGYGVSDATSGLHLILMALGIGPGDEVIFPSHTFVATAGAVNAVGAIPVPADIGPDGLVCAQSVEQKISPATRVIMPVHLNGRVCDMDAIVAIANNHDLLIVEDAAQAYGARYKGRYAGSFGVAASFSFYPAKSLGCFGDGGAIVTSDKHLAEKLNCMRDHGRSNGSDVAMWGVNSRLDNLQAAILSYRLNDFDQDIAKRRAIAEKYQKKLRHISNIVLPPAPNSDKVRFDTFQNYEIQSNERDELQKYLRAQNIGALVQWGGKAVHQFTALNFDASLPETEEYFRKCLMLPMNVFLSNEDTDYVCETVKKFYSNA